MADLDVGSTFAGHRIEGRAGRGGMGVVYRATDLRLDRLVALKLVSSSLAEDESFSSRFLRESRLAASIDHPNVIPIYHAGDEDGRLFLTMRYVEGTDLGHALERDRRVDPERAARIVQQVAGGLDAAHARGLVHRDVKPANILLERRGDSEHVYLTDFGLTKQAGSESRLTETGMLVGTVDYIAPEQVQGRDVDGRADVYALGCVLYEALSGRVPFDKPNQMAKLFAHVHEEPEPLAAVDAPPELAAVVKRAMEKDPGRRYQSAGEFGAAAAQALGLPSTAAISAPGSAPTTAPRPIRARRRPSPRVIAGACAVVAAAIVVAVLAAGGGGDGKKRSASNAAAERPAIMAVLRHVQRGFDTSLCRNDLTSAFRARYFAPRSGKAALNACENLGGGEPSQKPLVVQKLTVQGQTASARIDDDGEPLTLYLLERGGHWRVDNFTETTDARYQRQISAAIQPSFRNTPAIDKFVTGELRLADADGVPTLAVTFLRGAVQQVEGLRAPPGITDIHRRLVGAMRAQLAGAKEALSAQNAGDAKAFARAGQHVFAAIRALGGALDDLSRAQ